MEVEKDNDSGLFWSALWGYLNKVSMGTQPVFP